MIPSFIIIGAQKAGTTSLFDLLSALPSVYMPGQKELQFFNDDSQYSLGMQHYRGYFGKMLSHQICGEASPQYLGSNKAARRITEQCNQSRLIALLRDPIERATSHYHMTSRRGRTSKSLDQAISDRLTGPVGNPEEPDMNEDYLVLGEYGRQLAWYSEHFQNGLLHVLFLEDLKAKPEYELEKLRRYLGIDDPIASFQFPHTHRGGRSRFKRFDSFLRNSKVLRALARAFLSVDQRQALRFRYETRYNVRTGPQPDRLDADLERRVRRYFKNDTSKLEHMLGRSVPWR